MIGRLIERLLERYERREGLLLARGRIFGERRERNIYLPADLSNQHILCIGSSGSGKSRLIFHLSSQLIEDERRSLILMDPHGDLFQNLLRLIAQRAFGPEGRRDLAERVVLIEPANMKYGCPCLNILEHEEGRFDFEVVAELISAFRSIWSDSWGPRLEDILRNCCLALQSMDLTLVEMPWLLMDGDFRRYVVSRLENEDVRMYFEKHFPGLSEKDQRYFIESSRNKVSAFISNPFLKPILGAGRSTIRFAEIMNQGKICLINLSRSRLKTEARRLFGSLLMAKILMGMLSREEVPEEKRVPTTILVDEAHEVFCQDLFLPLLEGGRKYKVQLGLFHQSLSQLDPEDVDIILGNTAVQICFQVGRKDAERISREFWSFTGRRVKLQQRDLWGPKGKPTFYSVQEEIENAISELTNQGVRECYIKLKGVSPDPYIATTFPVSYPEPNPEWEESLRRISAKRYNRGFKEISREIEERRKSLQRAMEEQKRSSGRKAYKEESALSSEEDLFLRDVHARPFVPLWQRYKDLGTRISKSKASRIKGKLVKLGYIEEIELKTGKRGSQPKLLKLTEKGARYLGVDNPYRGMGKGGFQHQFWQHAIAERFRERGYKVSVEERMADLVLGENGRRYAVEVTLHNENVLHNVKRDLESGFDQIWIACPDISVLDKTRKKLKEELGEAFPENKIEFYLFKDLVEGI